MTPVIATQARTCRPAGRPPPLVLSELDERIIRAIAEYKYMTALDVWHLLGAGALSISTIRQRLRKLSGGDQAGGQYLFRFPLAGAAKGTRPRAYILGVKGRQALSEEGFYRPSAVLRISFGTLGHALALARFVCGASVFTRTSQTFSLLESRLCYELAAQLPAMAGNSAGIPIADAWLRFVRDDGREFPVWLEIDRNSEYRLRFQSLVRRRIEFIKRGDYARLYGAEAVRIAYLTTGGGSRRDAMRRWTEEVITEVISEEHQQGWCEKFYFTACVYEELFDPALWTDPVWQRPAFETTVPLLPPIAPNNKETTDGNPSKTASA
jgi:hypothetical protein